MLLLLSTLADLNIAEDIRRGGPTTQNKPVGGYPRDVKAKLFPRKTLGALSWVEADGIIALSDAGLSTLYWIALMTSLVSLFFIR